MKSALYMLTISRLEKFVPPPSKFNLTVPYVRIPPPPDQSLSKTIQNIRLFSATFLSLPQFPNFLTLTPFVICLNPLNSTLYVIMSSPPVVALFLNCSFLPTKKKKKKPKDWGSPPYCVPWS